MIIPANTEQWVTFIPTDIKTSEVEGYKPLVIIAWDVDEDSKVTPPVPITREGRVILAMDEMLVFGNKYQAVREQIVRIAERNSK